MAIFDPTIFQGLSGSVGNVTAYKLGDKHVVRGKAIVIKDAKTLVQLKQRERMRVVTALRRSFITVLEAGYCSASRKVCSNCFVRDNMRKIQVDDELNAEVNLLELSLSATGLALPLIGAEIDPEGGRVVFSWKKQPFMPYMFKDDCLYGCVYDTGMRRSRKVELGTRGVSGELAWTLPKGWDAGKLVVYGFAVSADGKRASGTLGITAS